MTPEKTSKPRVFPLRIEDNLYRKLKKLSYLTEISMSDIVRMGIELKIEAHKKELTNSDVVI